MTETIGEIIQTSTREMMGQVWRKQQSPAFGSLVMAKVAGPSNKECYAVGVVHNVQTTGADQSRLPAALEIAEEEIPMRHPQLSNLLRSYFHAYWIGLYTESTHKKDYKRFQPGLPNVPPQLHAGISCCIDDDIRVFFEDAGLFRNIYDASKGSEELLIQVAVNVIEAYGSRPVEVVRIGKGFSTLYRDDYDTLRRIMARLERWMNL
jgi:hypothetical protein